ncbi:MAG: hypothetical protein ACYCVL_03890 [Gemmatimonadaceae bacterium]
MPDVDNIGSHVGVALRYRTESAPALKTGVEEARECDDIQPMKTGKPSGGEAGTGYDVSVLAILTKIAADMAPPIASKAKLLGGRR